MGATRHSGHAVRLTAGLLLAAMLGIACSGSGGEPPESESTAEATDSVTLLLPFSQEIDASQYYFAEDFGFFKQCGLDVDIKSAEGVENPAAVLLAGKVDFAILDPLTYIAGLHQGLPYIAFMEDIARAGVTFISFKEDGITTPQDLPGHTVGLQPGSDNQWYLEKIMNDNLTPEQMAQVTVVPAGFSIQPLLAGKIDVYSLWTNSEEVFSLGLKGFEFNFITANDHGIDVMGDMIVTTNEMLQENPDLVRRFVAAVGSGFLKLTPENESLAVMSAGPRIGANRPPEVWSGQYEATLGLQQDPVWDQNGLGWNNPSAYAQTQEFLLENGKISEELPVDELFTNDVLESVYENGEPQIDSICQGPKGGEYTPPNP